MTVLGQQLISLVRAHAAEIPDFIYTSPFKDDNEYGACVYVHKGRASCLIGRALFDAGLIDASLSDGLNHSPIMSVIDDLNLKLDPEERRWLRNVQNYQDTRNSWGTAVAWADRDALALTKQERG